MPSRIPARMTCWTAADYRRLANHRYCLGIAEFLAGVILASSVLGLVLGTQPERAAVVQIAAVLVALGGFFAVTGVWTAQEGIRLHRLERRRLLEE